MNDFDDCPANAPAADGGLVTGRYGGLLDRKMGNSNVTNLRVLVRLFGLSPAVIARHTGVSRPYISRLLSRSDALTGSPAFWRRAEAALSKVIDLRPSGFF